MTDQINHECGISFLHLKKPIEFYRKKYGSSLYGIDKMYLLMEKQHNRGQDGAGFASIKFDMQPGERYISRIRSANAQPIQKIFEKINDRIKLVKKENSNILNESENLKKQIPYIGELMLGHVRYGTYGKNSIENVHPFLRQNNWMHRNLILAGNFNMTNVQELFENLIEIGQHPKEKADTITVMEAIGHFLDSAVAKIYKNLKKEGYSKLEASPLIAERLDMAKVLKKASRNWDGGYAIAGLLGHGDSFILRDPSGIRPAFYYNDDEILVVASERPAIQTVFNLTFDKIKEVPPGHAIINKKSGNFEIKEIITPLEKKSCSFERIYFSRGGDAEIYKERKKLGRLLFPSVFDSINGDIENTVFSFIPNTAEMSYYGMVKEIENHLSDVKKKKIKELDSSSKDFNEKLDKILAIRTRAEKIMVKDAKLRTFITQDDSRDEMVAHVYDITYGSLRRNEDSVVIIDDSIVRGTTLKQSVIRILDRLDPKKIVIVSSAPQIRYPDCYGIDMAKLGDFIAFQAAISLLKDRGMESTIENVYQECKKSELEGTLKEKNHVKLIYNSFNDQEISNKIATLLKHENINSEVKIIFQTVENLHIACPNHTGDWYFTGNYPTPGGNKVVNKSFINYIEGINKRAY